MSIAGHANYLKKKAHDVLKSIKKIQALSDVSDLAGIKSDLNSDRKSKISTDELSQLMGMDYARFSNILPYRYYDTDDQLFINDQSIGFGLELAPLAGANEEIIQAISELIKNKIKEDVCVQIMMFGSNKVGGQLSKFSESEKLKTLLDEENENKKNEKTEKIVRSKSRIVSLSLKQLPDELALWTQADNFCNIFKPNHGINCPFLISVHFKCEPQERSKLKAYKKASGYEKKANSPYAKLIPGTVQAAQDWKKIRDDLSTNETKLCKAYFNCVLFTDEKNKKEHISNTISSFRLNNINLYVMRYLQLQSYLSILPFVVEQGLWFDLSLLGRLNTMTTWNLSNMLPIVAEYKGAQNSKGIFAPTFRHQAATIDLFNSNLDNFNACICATSG